MQDPEVTRGQEQVFQSAEVSNMYHRVQGVINPECRGQE